VAGVGIALTAALAACGAGGGDAGAKPKYKIAITHVSRISVIDDNIKAFKDELAAKGFIEGKNVKYVQQDANGQRSQISLLARSMVNEHANLIYALGTDLNLAIAQLTDQPVLFGLMTDPAGSGLVESLEKPGGKTSGTSDFIDPKTYLDYLQLAVPDAKTVALMGNIGESNTASQIKAFKAEAESRGLKTVTVPVPTTNDIVQAVRSLKGRADALLIGADATLSSADGVVIKTATEVQIPVIFNGSGEAAKGALLGIGPDYKELGRVAGDMAAEVLGGKNPGDLPVALPGNLDLISATFNSKVAEALGIEPSPELLQKATSVETTTQ
jgi:putative ABC transport system substrate-binding protein